MIRFVLQRIGSTIGVLFALSVLVFLIFFAIPGIDPARQMAGRNPTPATLAAIRETFGLDKPLIETPAGIFTMTDEGIDQNLHYLNTVGIKATKDMFDTSLVAEIK